jgi:hypothetical protein
LGLIENLINGALGLKWKILTGAGVAATVIMGIALLIAYSDNAHLQKVARNQDILINGNPDTGTPGYVQKLAQAETNTQQLKSAIDAQRVAFEAKAAKDAAVLADTTRLLSAAQAETRDARAAAAKLLASPAHGDTLDARVRDVDARILETLK